MGKKLTYEEFLNKVYEKNEHVRNGEVEIRGEFINTTHQIECYCNTHNQLWYPIPNNLYKGYGCPMCGVVKRRQNRKLSNEEFMSKIMRNNEYVRNGELKILDEYVDMHTPILCICYKHNVEWMAQPQSLSNGAGCRKCGGDKLALHFSMTNEDFIEKVEENNVYVRNGDVEILGNYVNSDTPVQCLCHRHNRVWDPRPSSLYKGRGCPECGYENNGQSRSMKRVEFAERLNQLNNGIHLIGEYLGLNKHMDFMCSKGHDWTAIGSAILNGEGCPYCAGKKIWIGFNDLFSTRPDVAKLLKNPDDGYKYSAGSGQNAEFVCPDCGLVSVKNIYRVCLCGFSCEQCSDGISYPNKFARALIKQLDVQNVIYEWTPGWLKPYYYDNYFEYKHCCYVLEMDGGLGHGKIKFNSKERDVKGAERDAYKDSLAEKYNVKVIRIDCDYKGGNRFEYIKNNILNSELNILFDLSNIDWILCDKQAQRKFVAQVADLYNQGMCISEIKNIFNYSKMTIANWLRQAKNIGLCDYDPREAQSRGIKFAKKTRIQN